MINKINFPKLIIYTILIGVLIAVLRFLVTKVVDLPNYIYSAITIGWVAFVVLTLNKYFVKN
jgi:hypothetical protein